MLTHTRMYQLLWKTFFSDIKITRKKQIVNEIIIIYQLNKLDSYVLRSNILNINSLNMLLKVTLKLIIF